MKIMELVVYSVAWPEAYLRTKWHLDPSRCLATTDMGQKERGAVVFIFGEGAGSPSNTMSPGQRPSSVPGGIWIHSAVWSQQT